MDWFKAKITGNPHVSWENRWFPVDFPLSQSIEMLNHSGYLFILPSHWQHDAIPYIRLIPHFPTNMKISQEWATEMYRFTAKLPFCGKIKAYPDKTPPMWNMICL